LKVCYFEIRFLIYFLDLESGVDSEFWRLWAYVFDSQLHWDSDRNCRH
jgi:hypothetical protein